MRTVKVRTLLTFSTFLSTVPIIIMLLLLFSYSISLSHRRTEDLIRGTQQNIATSLTNNLSDIAKKTYDLNSQMEFLVFCNSSAKARLAVNAPAVTSRLSEQLFIHSDVMGIFLYNSQADYFYPCYQIYSGAGTNTFIENLMADGSDLLPGTWSLQTVNGQIGLFYSMNSRYGSILIYVDPNRNESFRSISANASPDTEWYFLDASVQDSSSDEPEMLCAIDELPLFLAYSETGRNYFLNIDRQQGLMLTVIILLILAVPAVYLILQYVLLNPIAQLSSSIHEIKAGNIDCRAKVSTRIEELKVFAENFNDSLDKIQELNREIYQHQLDVSMARLQYLQIQIRPHFYLNCLKNMYSLLDLKDYENIRRMILALSSYFSYFFRDIKNFVTLKDELNACQNYVDIKNITSSKVDLEFDIDGRSVNASCLPISVLTFVENCIKHSRSSLLRVSISTQVIQKEESEFLTVIIRDNGGGFSPQALEELNAADSSNVLYRHTQIGISNVRYRLWLIYRQEATVSFYNEGSDAIVKLTMPFEQRNPS